MIRTVHDWLPRAIADGSDLEARSQMLMASHLAGVGQASGTGVGLVHALGHALGTRGHLAHGTALAVVLPEVLGFYAADSGLRDRELALVALHEGRFIAVGRYAPNPDGETAEFALVVADAWQGKGLGRAILERLCRLAREAGYRALFGHILQDNPAMLGLARRLGFTDVGRDGGEVTLVRHL